MKDYKCYLFDFDGTLFDTEESLIPCYQYGFRAIGMDCTEEECKTFMHKSLSQTAEMKNVPLERLQEFVDAIVVGLDLPEALKLVTVFPDSLEILPIIKKKDCRIGVISGNCEPHMHSLLKEKQLDSYFECVVGNDSYSNPKPAAEPILTGLKRLNYFDLDNIVYVGDSLQDVECAVNAGVDGILIDRTNSHPDFKGKKIKSLLELINIS